MWALVVIWLGVATPGCPRPDPGEFFNGVVVSEHQSRIECVKKAHLIRDRDGVMTTCISPKDRQGL